MGKPIFVVTQSKEDYDREKSENSRQIFRMIWIIALSFFVYFAFALFNSTLGIIAAVVCFFANLLSDHSNDKIRNYANVVVGFYYLFIALLFLIVSIVSIFVTLLIPKGDVSLVIVFAFLFTALFAFLGYRKINENSNLFDKLRKKLNLT